MSTNSGHFDEEGILKNMMLSELALKISKLTFSWDNHSNSVQQANELMNQVRKLSLEISEYQQRMGSGINGYQRNQIESGMEELEKLISFMKNKIKPAESLEIVN